MPSIWGEEQAANYGYRPDHDWWYYRLPFMLAVPAALTDLLETKFALHPHLTNYGRDGGASF